VEDRRLTLTINLNFAIFVGLVLMAHLVTLTVLNLPTGADFEKLAEMRRLQELQKTAVQIIDRRDMPKIRKIGEKDGKGLNNVLVNKGVRKGLDRAKPNPFAAVAPRPQVRAAPPVEKERVAQSSRPQTNPYRPSTRPSALDQLALKAEPVKQVAARTQQAGTAALSGSPTLSKSLMNMQVEVPEGVAADELNQFELQFYGFQKRLVSKYLNSIELQVREYEKRFSMQTLGVAGKHTMTGRVTFDSDGNIKQIKMVRWTQADKLQSLFEDILKSMIALPNPPKMLRNSSGEFVVFYTLTVDNG
jgi:hypothetical protein